MLNQCQFIGNVGQDPEIRTMQDGSKVANLSLAVSEKWKDKNTGERKEKTEWIRVVIWGNLAGIVEQYVKKGSKLFISGKMQTRKWTDKEGVERYSTEVVLQDYGGTLTMLDSKKDGGAQPTQQPADSARDDFDDDIPFAFVLPLVGSLMGIAQYAVEVA